jgi:hypothetical protein
MPREGVVDALNIIHRALRTGAVLLDVHPLAAPASLALLTGDGCTTAVGQTDYSDTFSETITLAEQSLEICQRDGMFIEEKHTDFDSVHHFTTAELWERFRKEDLEDYVPATDELIATVNQALADPETRLLMAESARATRYRARST